MMVWQYKRELLLIVLAAISVGYVMSRPKPVAGKAGETVIHNLPTTLGPWQSKDEDLTTDVLSTLGARDYLLREYSSGDEKLTVYITYFDSGSGALTHNPEKCYTGAGWTFLERKTVPLPGTGQAVLFAKLAREDKRQATMYWYQRGDKVMVSKWAHISGITWRALAGLPTKSLVVSVAASADGDIPTATLEHLATLSREVIKALIANLAPASEEK
jgi:EpsI family protein